MLTLMPFALSWPVKVIKSALYFKPLGKTCLQLNTYILSTTVLNSCLTSHTFLKSVGIFLWALQAKRVNHREAWWRAIIATAEWFPDLRHVYIYCSCMHMHANMKCYRVSVCGAACSASPPSALTHITWMQNHPSSSCQFTVQTRTRLASRLQSKDFSIIS